MDMAEDEMKKPMEGLYGPQTIISAHLTLLDHTLAVDVCLSLCQMRGLWQNEIILVQYINIVW